VTALDLGTLLARVTALADGPAVRAIVLLGSLARGEASQWSDIDVERWVAAESERDEPAPAFVDGRLLMISARTLQHVKDELHSAERAIWAVPAYRSMRILVDRHGEAAEVHAAAEAFEWSAVAEEGARRQSRDREGR
jgi:pimeloyl-ACP methyl ester carboxylesterase